MGQAHRQAGIRTIVRVAAPMLITLALFAATAAGASAKLTSHGQLLKLGALHANTNTSTNWFGYNQGTLEKNDTLFNSITGDWTVPTATQHTSSQAESSSDWIGIGGGCVDSGCTVGDETLIQTGTEQDIDSTGKASYSAWWELVPAPSISISNMTVAPGDHMHASVAEVVGDSDLWTITLQDVTRNESFTQTVPYPSTHATAEWVEETPLEIGTDAGFASLPNLSNPTFTNATVNGANANLQASEALDLVDSNNNVIGSVSGPNAAHNGFDACTWATSCS